MTVLRATTFMSGILGVIQPMAIARASGVIVKKSVPWAKKPVTFSNTPYTIVNPHRRQAEYRVAFGEIVPKKVSKGNPAWKALKDVSLKAETAYTTYVKSPYAGKPERRTFHTKEELKKKLGIT